MSPTSAPAPAMPQRRWTFAAVGNFFALVVGGFAVATAASSVLGIYDQWKDAPIVESVERTANQAELRRLNDRLQAIEGVVAAITPSDRQGSPQLRILAAEVRGLRERQRRLERIIIRDPARALEMPLLQRDLQSARDVNKVEVDALKGSVDRLYALIFGIALGIFTLAATNLLSRKGKGE